MCKATMYASTALVVLDRTRFLTREYTRLLEHSGCMSVLPKLISIIL